MDHKIEKKIVAKEGSTMWSERKVRLFHCVALKSSVMRSDKWEEKYAEFEAYDGMPAEGTKSYYWKQSKLSNGPPGLDL